jgi:hypothetical protein
MVTFYPILIFGEQQNKKPGRDNLKECVFFSFSLFFYLVYEQNSLGVFLNLFERVFQIGLFVLKKLFILSEKDKLRIPKESPNRQN